MTCCMLQTDEGKITSLLVLLGLSTAFDTIDHAVLFQRLQHRIGIDGVALDWFKSYLSGRSQAVCINNEISDTTPLKYGLPEGSCVGPGLFPIYTLSLGDIIRRHQLNYHLYADDTQIYVSVKSVQADVDFSLQRIETCVDDIRTWMNQKFP